MIHNDRVKKDELIKLVTIFEQDIWANEMAYMSCQEEMGIW